MRWCLLVTFWVVYPIIAAAQGTRQPHVRFFNDSAKDVKIYLDGRFACSIAANPEGNNAYCDAEVAVGQHVLSIAGAKLSRQSCDVYVGSGGAEANLSKGEIFRCWASLSQSH